MEGGSLKSPYREEDEAEGLGWQKISKSASGERAGGAGISGGGICHHLNRGVFISKVLSSSVIPWVT